MSWIFLLNVVALIAGATVWMRSSFVPEATARELLRQGALVIDVRSPEEFSRGSIPGAINIPLNQLREQMPRHVKEQSQPLLVHCLSGGRSAIAQHQLKSMGYLKVFNLGSLDRAHRITSGQRGK